MLVEEVVVDLEILRYKVLDNKPRYFGSWNW